MSFTATEKILARASGKNEIRPGETLSFNVDMAFIQDNDAAMVIREFKRIKVERVWAPEKIAFVIDHHSPSTTVKSAEHQVLIRNFVKEQGIKHFFDCGQGVSHVLMLEHNLAGTGRVVVGLDSHTTGQGALGSFATGIGATEMAAVMATGSIWLRVPESVRIEVVGRLSKGIDARDVISLIAKDFGPAGANYLAIEFAGALIEEFDLSERTTLCLMSLEMGAKNSIIVPSYEKNKGIVINSDPNAAFIKKLKYDISDLEPLVACPSLPTNIKKVSELNKVLINQAVIGSCAGGSIRDLRVAANILKGRQVKTGVRFIVTPNSRNVYLEALRQGFIEILIKGGAIVTSPACGACAGYEVGVLAPGEVCISSTTRNMPGRMGPGGQVYLGSAATSAASAVTGYIADPRQFI